MLRLLQGGTGVSRPSTGRLRRYLGEAGAGLPICAAPALSRDYQGTSMHYGRTITTVATLCVIAICDRLAAQNPVPPGAQPPAAGRGGGGMRSASPQRPPADP